ncbi:MAG: hypothetical protein ABSF28_25375 [Terracidiphilus sp.]|jgi:hypothetical protein
MTAALALTPTTARAQGAQSSTANLSFPSPVATGIIGVKAPGALSEIVAHLEAVSATGWQDLEGTGTLTFPTGDTHSALLDLRGADFSRLDIVMNSGTRSFRVQGSSGRFQDEVGNQGSLLAATSRCGIVAFPIVWFDAATSSLVSLLDNGIYMGTGQPLHRVTVEYQLAPGTYTKGDLTVATDLYFEPNTHLLLYSVDSLAFSNVSGAALLRVTSYSDYQKFGSLLVPATIQQSLNGQAQWSLQLSQVQINQNPPVGTFSF